MSNSQVFLDWLGQYSNKFGPFINGKFFLSEDVVNTKSNYEISVILNENLINDSIQSAKESFKSWRTNLYRGKILRNVCNALRSKSELFAEISLATHGISSKYTVETDLPFAIGCFSYYADLADRLRDTYSKWNPYGVIGGVLLDDSSPLITLSWLTASALAGGNTIILLVKPHYSLISLAFASSLSDLASIPSGVLNVLPCVDEETFYAISGKFTRMNGIIPINSIKSIPSSVSIPAVMSKSHGLVPMLVLSSADIHSAVSCLMDIVKLPTLVPWFPNVIEVEESIFDNFISLLKSQINKLGDYRNEHESNFEYEKFINNKRNEGYEVLKLSKDYMYCLILLYTDAAIHKSVILDPSYPPVRVVSVISVKNVDEAISIANDSTCGIAASIWTNDSVQSLSLPLKLQCGTVWVNSYGEFDARIPFSPWKQYGHGVFSGKTSFYSNLYPISGDAVSKKKRIMHLYKPERNSIFPKRNIQNAIDNANDSLQSWSTTEVIERSKFLKIIADELNKFWISHYKIVLTETPEEIYLRAIGYLEFWSTYTDHKVFNKTAFLKDFCVISKSEPTGVISIIAGSIPFDILMYLISVAIIYGNTLVVGISAEDTCSILALELENIFSLINDKINVVVSDTRDLWQNFMSNNAISAIWYATDYTPYIPKLMKLKNIIPITIADDMRIYRNVFKHYCCRQKSIWLINC